MSTMRVPPATAAIALIAVLIGIPWLGVSEASLTIACQIGVTVVFAASFHLLFGMAGMLWFAHAITFAFGAYVVAHLLKLNNGAGQVPTLFVPLLAGLGAGLLSAAIGWVVTKREKLAFAMISLGIGELASGLAYLFRSVSGGEDGISFDRSTGPAWLGATFGPQRELYWLIVAWVIGTVFIVRFIERTPLGVIAIASRENPERLAFLGYNVRKARWLVFTCAGAISGVAGALAALSAEHVGIASLSLEQSALPLIVAIIGGVGSLQGTICAAVLLTLLQATLSTLTPAWLFYLGCVFTWVVIFAPRGLAGAMQSHRQLLKLGVGVLKALWLPYLGAVTVFATTALSAIALVELVFAQRMVGGGAVSIFALTLPAWASAAGWGVLFAGGLLLCRPAQRVASRALDSTLLQAAGAAR